MDLRATATTFSNYLGFGILLATGIDGLGRRSSAAIGRIHGQVQRAAANTRLGQHQLDALRRFPVASDVSHDRPNLLVAREHQEGWRATIGLHAREVEAVL